MSTDADPNIKQLMSCPQPPSQIYTQRGCVHVLLLSYMPLFLPWSEEGGSHGGVHLVPPSVSFLLAPGLCQSDMMMFRGQSCGWCPTATYSEQSVLTLFYDTLYL